jgi:hypothetical protein
MTPDIAGLEMRRSKVILPEGLNPGSYTPFGADNKLDQKALARELKLVTPGSSGLHGPAGHSEFASLTFEEWRGWTDVLVDVAHGAGVKAWSFLGAESFEKTAPYIEYAIKAGADGVWLIAPYFNLYSQEAGIRLLSRYGGRIPRHAHRILPFTSNGQSFHARNDRADRRAAQYCRNEAERRRIL